MEDTIITEDAKRKGIRRFILVLGMVLENGNLAKHMLPPTMRR